MTEPWGDDNPLPDLRVSLLGWLVFALRMLFILPLFIVGVLVSLIVQTVEHWIVPHRRPVSPIIVRVVFNITLWILGLRVRVRGKPMRGGGAVVANHSSWLDILVLNAPVRVHFVAKSEVEGWPVIGFLANLAGTLYIKRDRREARQQIELFRERLSLGHKLCFFPEGTSTDSRRVLPFKPTLFAAFFDPELKDRMRIQPVSVVYHAPRGRDPRFYGWYGDMDMAPSFLAVLGSFPQGRVELVFHQPVNVTDFADRKLLAAHCEAAVRGPLIEILTD